MGTPALVNVDTRLSTEPAKVVGAPAAAAARWQYWSATVLSEWWSIQRICWPMVADSTEAREAAPCGAGAAEPRSVATPLDSSAAAKTWAARRAGSWWKELACGSVRPASMAIAPTSPA